MPRPPAIVLATLVCLVRPAAADAGQPEIDVFVNAGIGVTRLSSSELAEIYNGSRLTWSLGKGITAFNLPTSSPLRVEFDRVVLHMSPDEVGRYWIDQRIRGGTRPPRQVEEPTVVVKLVARLPGSIGYAPAGTVLPPEVRVVARIRNRNVVEP